MQRTKLPWPEYRDKANQLFKQGIKPAQIKEQLGDPYWEGKSWHIKSNGRGGIARQVLTNRRAVRTRANNLRATRATSKGAFEAANYRNQLAIAKRQSDSTLHQHVSPYPSIVEHDVRLASGGSNSHTSISDPLYKQFKDNVESKVYSKFGDKYVVDVDDVSGGARVIPKASHNKFQHTSQQPGFTIDMGDDLDAFIKKISKSNLGFRGGQVRFTGGMMPGVIPYVEPIAQMVNERTDGGIDKAIDTAVEPLRKGVQRLVDGAVGFYVDMKDIGFDLELQ